MTQAFNIDCMDAMAQMKDNEFDLAIVDPPYGIDWTTQIKNPNTNKDWNVWENKEWDKAAPDSKYFNELFRVS